MPASEPVWSQNGWDGMVCPYVAWWHRQSAMSSGGSAAQQAGPLHFDQAFPPELNPLPAFARNPAAAQGAPGVPAYDTQSLPPDDAVIVAVIDSAIALGHQRFTDARGRSRILSAWQQSAVFRSGVDDHLPFGRETRKAEIDAQLRAHTHAGELDEDGFNAAMGLSDFALFGANNETEYAAGHGTHVLDLAAGYDPASPDFDAAAAAKRPILAVCLPDHKSIGVSGTFLQFFVRQALNWIVQSAEKIFEARLSASAPPTDGRTGYPMVINLSYGLHAGPKDSTSLLENEIARLIQQRLEDGRPPLRIVLPAGNDNLLQGNAVGQITADAPVSLSWRLLPEDQSPNFVEIWSEMIPENAALPLEIALTAPDGRSIGLQAGPHGHYLDAFGCIRVYCQRVVGDVSTSGAAPERVVRQRYVVCAAPTLEHGSARASPAGLWRITIGLSSAFDALSAIRVFAQIQTDQNASPSEEAGYLSYFDDPAYQEIGDDGSPRDVYRWAGNSALDADGADLEPVEAFGPVQRKGTLNALAGLEDSIVVAGHRASDGRPAPYSAAGHGNAFGRKGRSAPTISLPSDDGPAHPGLLGAGTRASSTAIMQGTSFSTALGTRLVSNALATWDGSANWADGAGSAAAFEALGTQAETDAPYKNKVFDQKSGKGRLPGPTLMRAARIDDSGL